MTRLPIQYVIFFLIPILVPGLPESTQNIEKRFTLQDLLSSQGSQVPNAQLASSDSTQPKTQTVDISTLLAAARKAASNQQPVPAEVNNKQVDLSTDKNGNINLGNLAGAMEGVSNQETKSNSNNNGLSLNDLQSLLSQQQGTQQAASEPNMQVVKEEFDVGKEKVELEAAGKRETRYALARGPDGGLSLVPVVANAQQTEGNKFQLLQPKGFEEKGSNRQQMQLTTLSQAMYSPFPSDQNTLHLHLKGKDGKDGKPGNKGQMGPPGPKGPNGPKGPKGDAGTCSSQINGLFECTPDELDSLSNRVDYLEKICKKKAPPPPFKPVGEAGTEGNPLPSCQAVYEKNTNSKSGAYWLMSKGVRFKTWCEFMKGGSGTGDEEKPDLTGGWTLVARVKGQANDWSPVSDLWANNETLNEGTAGDTKSTISMKNVAYNLVKSDVVLTCFTGRNTGCARFTHNKNMPLQRLFATQFGVVPEEQYTFAPFMKAISKSCDLATLRQSWCGLNVANVCDAKKANPNEKPPKTTHIVRMGCIGDRTATCFPDDYAIGIGVTSCKDGFGCSNVGQSKNMHYRCDYVYGAFSQTAYIYVL